MNEKTLKEFLKSELGGTEESFVPDTIPKEQQNFLGYEHLTTLAAVNAIEDFCLRIPPDVEQMELAFKVKEHFEASGYEVGFLSPDGYGLYATRNDGTALEGISVSMTLTDGGRALITVSRV